MAFKETVVHGRVSSAHLVQLFDGTDSLAAAVAAFLAEGFDRGDSLLIVATSTHWTEIAAKLQARGIDTLAGIESGRFIVHDARELLNRLMAGCRADASRFDAAVGAVVRELAASGQPLRIYGEMVDLLAAQGDYAAALRLEQLWNDLAGRYSFTLFCGYSAASFGNPRTQPCLQSICRAHTAVRTDPRDVLASFIVQQTEPGARSNQEPYA
jgi:hypothetical protein